MQILRIILMVCFVFTVYPSIGEVELPTDKVDIESDKRRWSPSGVPLGKEGGYQPDTDMKDLLDVEDTSDPQDVPTRRRSTNPIK